MTDVDIVTGGNGFIGSRLVDRLISLGRRVYVLDLPENDIRHPEFASVGTLHWNRKLIGDGVKINAIYHLAALADIVPSIQNPRDYYDTNVTGTLNVLEAARKYGCNKFIYAASASCYGSEPLGRWSSFDDRDENGKPIWHMRGSAEDGIRDIPNPAYPYALTKYLGEQLVMHWSKVYGIPAISLRIFNVYGEGQRASNSYGAMFKVFLAQLANDKPLTIVGNGTQQRDFIHVDDVVDAFIAAADSDKSGEIYNVGTGTPTSVNRIVELLGATKTINLPKRPGEPDITCADIYKIKKELGWEPKIFIEEGVARMREHIADYKDAPVWTSETIANATQEWFERLSA